MNATVESLATGLDAHVSNITLVKVTEKVTVAVVHLPYHEGDLREFQVANHHQPDSAFVEEFNELFMFDTDFSVRSLTFVDSPTTDDPQEWAIVTVVMERK